MIREYSVSVNVEMCIIWYYEIILKKENEIVSIFYVYF